MNITIANLGYWFAILTTILTIVTFGIAIFTPPLSGPYCAISCFNYPFSEITSRFPRDYLWMYPAIILSIAYYALMTAIHFFAAQERKIFSHIGLSFALISTAILVIDYFLQVSVIQSSLVKGETDGISLLSQFNPHGVFIALEEVAFFMMSLSFLFYSLVFINGKRLEKAIGWIFIANFFLTLLAFVLYTFIYGIFREYRFEVAVISINWLTLIISGILLSLVFKRAQVKLNGT